MANKMLLKELSAIKIIFMVNLVIESSNTYNYLLFSIPIDLCIMQIKKIRLIDKHNIK